jgi:hypothetical protein
LIEKDPLSLMRLGTLNRWMQARMGKPSSCAKAVVPAAGISSARDGR